MFVTAAFDRMSWLTFFESMLLLFCPVTFVSDNHFRFFFSRLDYFFGDNLKLRLKVSAVIAGWGHASLFVENGIVLGKTTGHSRLALLRLVNLKITK
jgi:hypothetical protein